MMDENELIKRYSTDLEHAKGSLEASNMNKAACKTQITILESTLAILNRTRTRDTIKEPPTRKDADNPQEWVMAFRDDCYDVTHWVNVKNMPDIYTKWTQLPEVTP